MPNYYPEAQSDENLKKRRTSQFEVKAVKLLENNVPIVTYTAIEPAEIFIVPDYINQ